MGRTTETRSVTAPIAPILIVLALGTALVTISVLVDPEAVTFAGVAYDLGMGALVATAVAAVLGRYMSSIEKRSERAEQARQRSWAHLEEQVDALGREMDRTLVEGKISDVGIAVKELEIKMWETRRDVMAVREKVDPTWVHPDQPLRDELMAGLKDEVARAQSGDQGSPDVAGAS